MEKTYYIGTSMQSGSFNFIKDVTKVSETIFNDMLAAKIKELLGEEAKEKFDECLEEVSKALESKKPITILDRNFEIKFKKAKIK